MLDTTTAVGLHDFVIERVIPRYLRPGTRAVDLGAGTGALAVRLRALGAEVVAVERHTAGFGADVSLLALDLDRADFATDCGRAKFGLVTAVEVIEHMESPIGFLRNIGWLLAPGGHAVITTPNVENLPARLKLLLFGKVRTMDENGEPTHISPIYLDLLRRQFLPRTGLRLVEHLLFPPGGYSFTRRRYAWPMRLLARVLPGEALAGDNHVFVFSRHGDA